MESHRDTIDVAVVANGDHEASNAPLVESADAGEPPATDVANGEQFVDAQDFQSMTLVIRTADRTIEIPLNGNMILQNSSQTPQGRSQGNGDLSRVDNMRGWLLTVATLFIGITFQAAMQPPAWMPKPDVWPRAIFHPDTLSPDVRDLANIAANYHMYNALTFVMALGLALHLLCLDQSTPSLRLKMVVVHIMLMSLFLAAAFLNGITYDGRARVILSLTFLAIFFPVVAQSITGRMIIKIFSYWRHPAATARPDEPRGTMHQELAGQEETQVHICQQS